jgi:hypothetical protein
LLAPPPPRRLPISPFASRSCAALGFLRADPTNRGLVELPVFFDFGLYRFVRQILYANQVGRDRAPHTPTRVWAGPGRLFRFLLFFSFLFLFRFSYSFHLFMIWKMLKFKK